MISKIQKKHQLVKRNGIEYYTIEGIETIQGEMCRLLNIIDHIATENNIHYWLSSGSIIGAIRHQGFIPWDDDLDIELLKDDYIKLIACLTDYSNTHDDAFIFFPAPQEVHCCNYFASNNYFLRTQGSPYVYPAKVDIRPFNCIQNTKEKIDENNKLRDIANYLVFGKSYGFADYDDLATIRPQPFFKEYNAEYGLYDPQKDDAMLVPPYYEYSVKFDFDYNSIFPLTKKQFESFQINIPKESDYILSSIYGDYMKLPQLNHRVPVACDIYIKRVPTAVLKKYYYNATLDKRFSNKLRNVFFLIKFHGIFNFIKYFFFEKKVKIGSNYEETINKW